MLGVVGLGGALVGTPNAGATGLAPAVVDCNLHAALTRNYTIPQLQNALATMPADVREYSDCYTVIQHQLLLQLGELHGQGGAGQGGGPFLPAWLIVILAVLVATAGGFGVLAVRNRRAGA